MLNLIWFSVSGLNLKFIKSVFPESLLGGYPKLVLLLNLFVKAK